MFLFGVTGGIASGKSTVAQRLGERGAELIDADEIARELLLPGTEAWHEVVAHFGRGILDGDGFVDRRALGRIVFADPRQRAVLNEITHPRVMAEIADRLELLAAFDGVVVVDVPLLVEARARRAYDAVLVVAARPETQLRRLVAERGLDPDEARARIDAQAPLEDKLAVATHVLWNEGPVEDTLCQADGLAAEFDRRARDKARVEAAQLPDD